MLTSDSSPRLDWLIGRTIATTFLVLLGVLTLSLVAFEFFGPTAAIPAYLVYSGSDVIQNPLLPRLSGIGYSTFVAGYLYGLAVVFGNGYRLLTNRRENGPVEDSTAKHTR
ncbi:hypothetical protein [Halomarina rubra]|uniref:Cox cluster protein n=1 Tax=Halomarina rubra TaxID=2071873 RepID=A0ABD6AXK3_9EURY|nr:hypothetical protein [Halomarina rubra]